MDFEITARNIIVYLRFLLKSNPTKYHVWSINKFQKLIINKETFLGSINLICCPLGSIISGPLTQRIGRRRCMQFVTLPFFASWLIFYFSNSAAEVFLALCITGFSGGLLEAPVSINGGQSIDAKQLLLIISKFKSINFIFIVSPIFLYSYYHRGCRAYKP